LKGLQAAERMVAWEVRRRRFERAAAHAELAGRFASQRHPGRFVSLSLEHSLDEVGMSLVTTGAAAPNAADLPVAEKAGVLHVTTRNIALGGHTRWIQRVIEADTGRPHSLVVTKSGGADPPDQLIEAVAKSGGAISTLPAAGRLQRARHLRALAAAYELVVLSTDPGDVVPSLAFAAREGRSTIARFNHSDHIFWLGAGVTDFVIEFRPAGARVTRQRRGFAAERTAILPLPINVPPAVDRTLARRQLGLSDDRFVVVSIGAPYKFEPFQERGYLDVVEPVLERLAYLTVLTVGPEATGRWARAQARFGVQLLMRRPTPELAPYFAAADAFLNPMPIGSDTVLWEAAATGLPVITLRPAAPGLELMRTDPSELRGAGLVPADSDGLAAVIEELHAFPEKAREFGTKARQLVLEDRVGPAWASALADVLTQAASAPPITLQELQPSQRLETVDGYVSSWASLGSLPQALRRALKLVTPKGR
jgi:glycosyltransferase involved in cell wall biosynthesis